MWNTESVIPDHTGFCHSHGYHTNPDTFVMYSTRMIFSKHLYYLNIFNNHVFYV